jgi:hypothetical protein
VIKTTIAMTCIFFIFIFISLSRYRATAEIIWFRGT